MIHFLVHLLHMLFVVGPEALLHAAAQLGRQMFNSPCPPALGDAVRTSHGCASR